MFSLAGPCELLFLLYFIASWTRVVVNIMLYPCIFCIDLSLMRVACLGMFGETIRTILGVVVILYGLPKSACCVCVPSVYLDGPSIGFVCVCVSRKFVKIILAVCMLMGMVV